VKMVINPALGPQIPGATRVAVDSIQQSMVAGRFVVPIDSALLVPAAVPAAASPTPSPDSAAGKT
jgi:hypothetical protein